MSCPNCGEALTGKYCSSCGQKRIGPEDRTLTNFFRQFIGSAFLLENNFLKNLWVLVWKPGLLPLDFREGRRKRWMPPLSVFLLLNFFYFIYTPFSDLALSLRDQVDQPLHGWLAGSMVKERLEDRQVDPNVYAQSYQEMTTTLANSLVILHAPLLAGFLALMFWRRRLFFLDHVIYCLYFFATVLLLALFYKLTTVLFSAFMTLPSDLLQLMRNGLLILLLINLGTSLRRFYGLSISRTLLLLPVAFVGLMFTHLFYRTILFLVTFAVT